MNASSDRKAASHDRIVRAAARTLRQHGFAQVGVADVMREAGLTHGGFYAHFDSRETMLAEALEHAGVDSARQLAEQIDRLCANGASPLRALLEVYLSEAHLVTPGEGCPAAALGAELSRQRGKLRESAARRVGKLQTRVAKALPAGSAPADALVLTGAMIGVMQMLRVVDSPARARRQLAQARETLMRRFGNEESGR